jgi:mRNA interferase MazF
MRLIYLVQLDKRRPAVVLTRELALPYLNAVTVAPITSTIRGIATEVSLGRRNGLGHPGVANYDLVTTIPKDNLLTHIGYLLDDQETALAARHPGRVRSGGPGMMQAITP